MNLEAFKKSYFKTISESVDDSDLKNWIRSIVEEILFEEYSIEDLTRKIKSLDAMIAPSSGVTDGERENAIKLKQNLQKKLQDLQQTTPTDTNNNDYKSIMKSYGFSVVKDESDTITFRNSKNDEIVIYPRTKSLTWFLSGGKIPYVSGVSKQHGKFNNLDTWMSNNTKYTKIQNQTKLDPVAKLFKELGFEQYGTPEYGETTRYFLNNKKDRIEFNDDTLKGKLIRFKDNYPMKFDITTTDSRSLDQLYNVLLRNLK